jgi:hypothetical protein
LSARRRTNTPSVISTGVDALDDAEIEQLLARVDAAEGERELERHVALGFLGIQPGCAQLLDGRETVVSAMDVRELRLDLAPRADEDRFAPGIVRMVGEDHPLPVEHLQHGELGHVGEAPVLQHEVGKQDHVRPGFRGRAGQRLFRDVAAQHQVLHHVLGRTAEDGEPRLGHLHPVDAGGDLGGAQVVHRLAQALAKAELHAVQGELLAHARLEHLALERLVDVVDPSGLEAAHLVLAVGPRGEEDDRRLRDAVGLEAPADLEAVHALHVHVHQDEVGLLGARELERVGRDVRVTSGNAHRASTRGTR